MSRDINCIGMDVHKEAIVIAVLNGSGNLVMETILETKASSIPQFIHGRRKTHSTVLLKSAKVRASNTKGTAMRCPLYCSWSSRLSYWQFSGWGVESEVRTVSSG